VPLGNENTYRPGGGVRRKPLNILVFPKGDTAESIAQAIDDVDERVGVLVPATADEALDIMGRSPATDTTAPPDLAVIILTSADSPAWRVLCDAKQRPETHAIPVMALICPASAALAYSSYAAHVNACLVAPTAPEGWHDLAQTLVSFWGETAERVVQMR